METLADRFNKHLDRCPQCKNNPFNLCGIGQVILNAVVAAGMVSAQQSVHPTRRSVAQKGKSKSKGSVKPARG